MMDIMKIDENTYCVEDDKVRYFILIGTEQAIMIDTGMNNANAIDAAKKVTDKPIVLLNTHADRDHIAGNGAFSEMYMSPNEVKNYRENGGKGIVIPVSDKGIIDIGDRPLEIIELPGHTPGSIAVLDVNNRALYSGDSVQNGIIFMFGKNRNMEQYIESLKKLRTYEGRFDRIYPCHGDFPVYPELTQKLIDGAETILKGEAEGKEMELFGNKVMMYKFDYAGFFCEIKKA